MKVSFILPSRENLKYLKWAYAAIRKNQGNHTAEICVADDFSSDGTWEWCLETMKVDPNFKAIRNEGPTRLGHTILYDRLVNEVASHEVCMIYHADMYLCPGALDAIEEQMYNVIDAGDNGVRTKIEKTIVSLTRIEPPLHPPGPEKVFIDWGATEPEDFDEEKFLSWFETDLKKEGTTEGIFAPWAFWKSDFQEIGGHDALYAPQSKEDSDIFNRFQLNGVKFVQTWKGFVYHMTCRGSRFNPLLTTPGQNSNEWEEQNVRSTRNFIRKWGHFCKHDALMKPIIPPKYDVGFKITNCTSQLLTVLEPWCSTILIDDEMQVLTNHYLASEQKNTKFDLSKKIKTIPHFVLENEIQVEINGASFTNQDFTYIQQLSEIIKDNGAVGSFQLGNLKITISAMNEYQSNLIFVNNENN